MLHFNPAQQEAVEHQKGPMLVLAGPGSGKTAVITGRTCRLIEDGVAPSSILVVTFTRAAAGEMRRRFLELQGTDSTQVTFGTFHSVFYSILRHSYHIGAQNILTEEEKIRLLKELLQQCREAGGRESDLPLQVSKEISVVKSGNLDPAHYFSTSLSQEDFRGICRSYEAWKRQNRKLDFDDIIRECWRLFRGHPDILAAWQKRFSYLLVDEFQDISPLQYEILRMLAEPERNLFIVGDDDQSIYRFRGASPEIMLRFPGQYPEAKQVVLTTNYRSTPEILQCAGELIRHNRKRFAKQIRAHGQTGLQVSCGCYASEREELQELTERLRRDHREGIPWEEQAVLLRTNGNCRSVMEACMSLQIPFRMGEQIPCIYDHWIAGDLLAYLRLAAGGRERGDFLRICNRPNRYLSRNAFADRTVSFEELYWFYEDKEWMCDRLETLERDLKVMAGLAPYGAIRYLRQAMGYDEFLREYALSHRIAPEDLLEVVEELTDSCRDCRTLADWAQQMEEFRLRLQQDRSRQRSREGVMISTLHASKGLEYTSVHLPNLNEGIVPYHKAVLEAEMEEERRMLYVGMTRAARKLSLYYLRKYHGREMEASRFLKECGML